MGYEKFGFIKSPYDIVDAFQVEERFLVWDRSDLNEARTKLDHFIDDVINGRRVGLKIFGQTGSGKTWLTRLIQKEISEKSKVAGKKVSYIYTTIPQLEPEFSVIYKMAIEHFLENDFKLLEEHVKQKYNSTNAGAWENVIAHKELQRVFSAISSDWETGSIAKKWLVGERMSSPEMTKLNFTYSLDGDYKRFQLLKELLHELNNFFDSVVFVIDELENVSAKNSGPIGDSLRTLLDSFAINFALIATFTAEKEDEWYDIGYSEQLSRRFDYSIRLDSVKSESVEDFIKTHNKVYLENPDKSIDHLLPFKSGALAELLRLMTPENHYPGYILPNCSILSRELFRENKNDIDTQFVQDHKLLLNKF